jgi:hypothetical protein
MRKTCNQQLPPAEATADHPKAKELLKISKILDHDTSICDLALQDLGLSDNRVEAKEFIKVWVSSVPDSNQQYSG